MTALYNPEFNEPAPKTPQEQLTSLENERWNIMDELKVVDMLIATLRNQIKGEVHDNH